MSKEQTAIGPWLYLPLLIIPVMGYGLMNMPHYAAKVMGANGYLGGDYRRFSGFAGDSGHLFIDQTVPRPNHH